MITKLLLKYADGVMRKRPPDVDIGKDEFGRPYLRRWWAIPRNKVFNIYIHEYWHDDDRILHSHPWWSWSICLKGELREYYTPSYEEARELRWHRCRHIRAGQTRFRDANMYHRLEVMDYGTVTIFFTGPLFKMWYFACRDKKVPYKVFHDRGGCGEDGA